MEFREKVYSLTRKIPKGRITTYREIAKKLKTKAYRMVGKALKQNPFAPEIPCHRVVCSDGSLGGYKGKLNSKKKAAMLRKEGIVIKKGKVANFKNKLFRLR
jgi:methylated-DNA-[protein]-cysteine S-methyltransferase